MIDNKTEKVVKDAFDITYDHAIDNAIQVVKMVAREAYTNQHILFNSSVISNIISELSKLKSNDHANNNNEG